MSLLAMLNLTGTRILRSLSQATRGQQRALAVLVQDVKNRQSPLKAKYSEDPDSAIVVMKAEGTICNETMSVKVLGGPGQCVADNDGSMVTMSGLHSAAGGDGTEACSGDMLLQSLVACAGVTFRAVWNAFGMGSITSGKIVATGEMDFRGTLGVDKTAPVGLTKVDLEFEIDSEEDPGKVAKAVAMTERFCVIYQTLRSGVDQLEGRTV